MKQNLKKYLIIFTLILTIFTCTACSDDSKDSSSNASDVMDALTAANMTKYVEKSREAGDKQLYDELKTYFTIAAATDESAKFCKDNAPITATINNDGVTIVDKNGKKLAADSAFMKTIDASAGGDITTSMKCKTKGAEYKLTIKSDLTIEETLAPEE
jgi:hypothetical protein